MSMPNDVNHSPLGSNLPDARALRLREEYIRFVNDEPVRSPERQKQLEKEIADSKANGTSLDMLSLIVQYNYEDGFYEDYPLILEDLIKKGKIPAPPES